MKKVNVNVETAEVIEEELTVDELEQYQLDQQEAQIKKNLLLARMNAKAALLEKLGITEEEAKLLLS